MAAAALKVGASVLARVLKGAPNTIIEAALRINQRTIENHRAAVGNGVAPTKVSNRTAGGRGYSRSDLAGPDGAVLVELWMIEGAGHAWSGGRAAGSYTDSKGPDASAHMIRFCMAKSA